MRPQPHSGNNTYIDHVIDRIERKNCELQKRLEEWLNTLDAIGVAVARANALTTEGFALNATAQRDLDLITPVADRSLLEERVHVVLWSDPMTMVWRPTRAQIDAPPLSTLTRREREVHDWLQQGKTLAETAIILGVSPRTVEKHRSNLYRKLSEKMRGAS